MGSRVSVGTLYYGRISHITGVVVGSQLSMYTCPEYSNTHTHNLCLRNSTGNYLPTPVKNRLLQRKILSKEPQPEK